MSCRRGGGVAISVVVLAFVAGCTLENSPTSTHVGASSGVQATTTTSLVRYGAEQTAQLLDSGLTVKHVLISAKRGGEIVNGPFTLEIPGDALTQDVLVSIVPTSAYEMIVRAEPTGLQFQNGKTALLRYDWSGTDVDPSEPSTGRTKKPVAWGTTSGDSSLEKKLALSAMWFNPSTGRGNR